MSTMQAAVNDQMDRLDVLVFRLLDMLKSAGITEVREEPLISVYVTKQYAFNVIMYGCLFTGLDYWTGLLCY